MMMGGNQGHRSGDGNNHCELSTGEGNLGFSIESLNKRRGGFPTLELYIHECMLLATYGLVDAKLQYRGFLQRLPSSISHKLRYHYLLRKLAQKK